MNVKLRLIVVSPHLDISTEARVRLHRFLVPIAAAIVILGIVVALILTLQHKEGGRTAVSQPATSTDLAELLDLKNQAEKLAIDNKLAEAHAKYRELFLRAQGHDIKDPAYWDLMERAKIDQDWIYRILLSQRDPARVLTPPLPRTQPASAPEPRAVSSRFIHPMKA